jgi:hypothetical protein
MEHLSLQNGYKSIELTCAVYSKADIRFWQDTVRMKKGSGFTITQSVTSASTDPSGCPVKWLLIAFRV